MESVELGQQLMEWAKKMGYAPPPGQLFPDVSVFQKLCKGKMIPVWQQIIETVRPAHEVEHIRKTLLLNQLKTSKGPLPGSTGEKYKLLRKIEEGEKKQSEALARVNALQEAIQKKRNTLLTLVAKGQDYQRQKKECEQKLSLIKLKKRHVLSGVKFLKDLTVHTEGILPPMLDKAGKSPSVAVKNCIGALQKFHSSKGQEADDDRQTVLWNSVASHVDGLTAKSLWSAISQLMCQSLDEISSAGVLVSLQNSSHQMSDLGTPPANEQLRILYGKYLESYLEGVLYKSKIKLKSLECAPLLEKLTVEILSKNCKLTSNPENVEKWVKLQFLKATLLGTLRSLEAEGSSWKDRLPNFSVISSELEKSKERILQLEEYIASEKRHIESSLATVSHTAENLLSAKSKVSGRLEAFKSLSQEIQERNKEKEKRFSSLARDDSKPLSSTLIGNITGTSNITFNSSFSSDSLVSSTNSGVLSPLISVLKESLSSQTRTFFKLPLETVPFVVIDNIRIPECCLLVNAHSILSRNIVASSDAVVLNLFKMAPGAPVSDTPTILLKLLSTLNHKRALHLCQLSSMPVASSVLCVHRNIEALKIHSTEQQYLKLRSQDIEALIEEALSNLSACKETHELWSTRRIQEAVPSFLQVNQKPFSVWKKEYEASLKRG